MNEYGEIGTYISSYQDALIINLRPTAFAIRFRRLVIGGREKSA